MPDSGCDTILDVQASLVISVQVMAFAAADAVVVWKLCRPIFKDVAWLVRSGR